MWLEWHSYVWILPSNEVVAAQSQVLCDSFKSFNASFSLFMILKRYMCSYPKKTNLYLHICESGMTHTWRRKSI